MLASVITLAGTFVVLPILWRSFRDQWRRIPPERRPRAIAAGGATVLLIAAAIALAIAAPWGRDSIVYVILVGFGGGMLVVLVAVAVQAVQDTPNSATARRSLRPRAVPLSPAAHLPLRTQMARGSAVRNRSESVTVGTPRGPVEVVRQEVRGLRRNSGWTWFWMARRAGNVDYHEASTPAEAIRRAILLPARKPPVWLREAAATAEQHLLADGRPDDEQPSDSLTPSQPASA